MDMTQFTQAKSDQLNSDDLIAGPKTIRILAVETKDSKEQPVTIRYDGDNGKPWKPCKTTIRALVQLWGKYGQEWVGKSLTLYRDAEVKWAGACIGGIRISHMSHIDGEKTISETTSKAVKKPRTIRPLVIESPESNHAERLLAAKTIEELVTAWASVPKVAQSALATIKDNMKAKLVAAQSTSENVNGSMFGDPAVTAKEMASTVGK